MRKYIIAFFVFCMVVPMLFADFTYLSEAEYKELSSKERQAYNDNLVKEMEVLQQRKADAIARSEGYEKEIGSLQGQIGEIDTEYENVKQEIYDFLGVSAADLPQIRRKISYYSSKIDNWNKLSDTDLWNAKKAVTEMIAEYNEYRNSKYGKMPDVRGDFSDLDNRIEGLMADLERAKPKYFEDEYTVKKGDYLAKISGYSFIYNDPTKWGIIYRANRDKIKDPNLIYADQILNIPRGKPYNWSVWKGESLWKIASYPEIYGKGSEWPRIYRENEDQIKDPNLIYPKQVFSIPR